MVLSWLYITIWVVSKVFRQLVLLSSASWASCMARLFLTVSACDGNHQGLTPSDQLPHWLDCLSLCWSSPRDFSFWIAGGRIFFMGQVCAVDVPSDLSLYDRPVLPIRADDTPFRLSLCWTSHYVAATSLKLVPSVTKCGLAFHQTQHLMQNRCTHTTL